MMWGVTLIFFSYVAAQVTSDEIEVKCREFYDFPPTDEISPSFLADLKVDVVIVEENYMLNISWAINIDASIRYLTGTQIIVGLQPPYLCEYIPSLAKAELTGPKKWFYHLVSTTVGYHFIQASNLPLPPLGSGSCTKSLSIKVSQKQLPPKFIQRPTEVPTAITPIETTTSPLRKERVTVAIFGGLAGLMILSFSYIIYRNCGPNIAKSFGFKYLPTSPMVPVPVLMVYTAENSAFQEAVVALAEFLQSHGGCSVAIDIWQQRKIAELGPMRWLAEQVTAADRVLIVCPHEDILSPQPGHSPPNHSFSESSIPAAAHDLYPLILNMVASHAKSSSELAKFWVVQLGMQQDKRPSNLALELRTCKTFCLMKNFNKLCRSLHTQRQDEKKISDVFFRPGILYNDKSTVKLRKAVEKLTGHEPSISREIEPLKSVATSV